MKKKIIAVLCSIIMVIPLVFSTPKAAGSSYNGNGTFSKGSYTYSFSVIIEQTEIGLNLGTEGVGLNIPWATGSSFTINFQFNDTYTGSIGFTLKSNTGAGYRLDQCLWAVNGGYFKSSDLPSLTTTSTSKTFVIYCYNTTSVSFSIVTDSVNTFHPTSTQFTGFGVQSFYYNLTDSPDVVDVYNKVSDIDLYIPGMSTSLSNIDSDLDNIAQNIQALSPYIDQLEPYMDALINSTWNYPQSWTRAWMMVSSMNDTAYRPAFGHTSNNYYQHFLLWEYWNNTNAYNSSNSWSMYKGQVIDYYWICDNSVSWSDTVHIYSDDGRLVDNSTSQYKNLGQMWIYHTIISNQVSAGRVSMQIDGLCCFIPIFWGDSNYMPDDICTFLDKPFNNTYTSLLQSLNNGISALNEDYDTSAYDNYEQTIDGLNDNMRDRFNNSETNFQNSINNILTPDQSAGGGNTIFERFHFNAINSVFTGFLSDIFTAAPAIQYVLLFGLLLLVLGVFI